MSLNGLLSPRAGGLGIGSYVPGRARMSKSMYSIRGTV